MDGDSAGGSVVVAEALRRRRTQERARWEAFQRRKRESASGANEHGEAPRAWWAPRRAAAVTREDGGVADAAAPRGDDAPDTHALEPELSAERERAETDAPDDEPPSCRICFAGEEEGRLFSPCRCRGTMKHVHVKCLDAWRRASQRGGTGGRRDAVRGSYVACDQCHFRYRLERSEWAARLEDPRLPGFVAAVALAIAVWLTGGVSRFIAERAMTPACARVARALRRAPERYSSALDEWEPLRRLAIVFERLAAPRPSHAWRLRLAGATEAAGAVSDANPLRLHYARAVARALEVWGTKEGNGAFPDVAYKRSVSDSVETASTKYLGTSPLHVEFLFYALTGWRSPPWWDPLHGPRWIVHRTWVADSCDRLVAGVAVVGVLGFAAHVAQKFKTDRRVADGDGFLFPYRDVLERVVLPVVATFLTRGAGASRLLVFGGVFWCAVAAHARAKEIATRALQKFGERVLEPTEAELARE
jgi:hypothetical protein